MANTIQHKRSSTSGVAPAASGLSQGELAINIADGKLYTKNNSNTVINLGVTSISGTYITPASGNFSNSLKVNGVEVSVSGHNHDKVTSAGSLSTAVFNKTGNVIPKFSVVYINGGQGDQPTINLAIGDGESGSSKTYGITAEAISNMASGTVIVAGALTGVNTDQFNPTAPTGDVNGSGLWLSPSVSGGVTLTKPSAPNHAVYVATIVRTHQNAGVVEVRVQNGFELQELHNVALNGTTNGQFLQYNSASGLWVASSSGNFTNLTINNNQIVTGSGTSNYIPKWTSSSGLLNSSIYIEDSVSAVRFGNNNAGYCYISDDWLGGELGLVNGDQQSIAIRYADGSFAYGGGFGLSSSIIVTSGNVGIGTSAPSEKFEVNGNGVFNSVTAGGNVTLGLNPTFDQYGVFSTTTNPLWIISDLSAMQLVSQYGITIDGDANHTILQPSNVGNVGIGTTTPNYKLDVNGSIGDSTNGLISIQNLYISDSNPGVIVVDAGTNDLNIGGDGTIDINSNVDQQINLNGNTIVAGNLTSNAIIKASGLSSQFLKANGSVDSTSYQPLLTNPVTGTGINNHIAYWNSASGIIADSGQLFWDSTNNRLGLSTNAPATNFHLSGSSDSNHGLIMISGTSTTTHFGLGISDSIPFLANISVGNLSTSVYGWGMFYRLSDGDFALSRKAGSTSWVRSLNIQRSNGNIGIGSGVQATAPAERLVVDGTVRIADGAGRVQFYRGGGTAYDYTIGREGNHLAVSTSIDSSTFRYIQFGYHSGSTWTPQTVINGFNGNIGIGTTSPNNTARLTIAGSGNTSASAGLSIVNSSSTNLMYVRDDGNIGIGTTTPSTKLHVNGIITQSAVHASAGLSTDQTITANSDTVLQLTDKDDPNNWWNASTYRFLPTASGYYFIAAQVNWEPGAGSGQLNIQLRKNGNSFSLCQDTMITNITLTQHVNGIVNLNGSTDYVELTAYTATTNASQIVNGTADRAWTKLEAYKIS